ncbi:MAG: RimK/LysX family protein [Deltaproteobacteria bacterium]
MRLFLQVFVAALLAGGCISYGWATEKLIVGWVEKALIRPGHVILDAKVDTGADNTSLDARNITTIDRGGKKFVRFEVDNRRGDVITLEREQMGIEVVPRHDGRDQERPLVTLEICLGLECRRTVVNLVDRSRFKYPLLVGRSFLLDRAIVDPLRTYLTQPMSADSSKP